MRKIFLQKITQHENICYIGKIDPRQLAKVAVKIEMGEVQDAQRPLSKKRVKDIATYVDTEKGLLPNTLTFATKDDKYQINKVDNSEELYYLNFPETDEEFLNFTDSIDVMDGQHRLYSFTDENRTINDNCKYEIGFTLYLKPTLPERRMIFVSCNEKQEKVNNNLLMWFKAELKLLPKDDSEYFKLITALSKEYPLKGHIIISAEPIKKGVKARQIIEALKKAQFDQILLNGNPLTQEQQIRIIRDYLTAWQSVVCFSFTDTKDKSPAVKMAGLTYMLLLLPCIWDRAILTRTSFSQNFVEDTLKRFMTKLGIPRNEFFTHNDTNPMFRDSSNVNAFAKKSINIIRTLENEDFNPLA